MVAESVAAKIFKIGSVVFEIWPFYYITVHCTLWRAFVITKNEHTLKVWKNEKWTYSESLERRNCLIALYCCLDICGHMSGQMLDL